MNLLKARPQDDLYSVSERSTATYIITWKMASLEKNENPAPVDGACRGQRFTYLKGSLPKIQN